MLCTECLLSSQDRENNRRKISLFGKSDVIFNFHSGRYILVKDVLVPIVFYEVLLSCL